MNSEFRIHKTTFHKQHNSVIEGAKVRKSVGPHSFFFPFAPSDTKVAALVALHLAFEDDKEPSAEKLDFLLGSSDAAKSEVADMCFVVIL